MGHTFIAIHVFVQIILHYIYNIFIFLLVSSYPLSSFESELVQLLVYCYTPVVSSWLETEADVMELFLYLLSSTSPLSPTLPSLALMAINQVIICTCTVHVCMCIIHVCL